MSAIAGNTAKVNMKYATARNDVLNVIFCSIATPLIKNAAGNTSEVTRFFTIYIVLNLTRGYEYRKSIV